MKSPARGGRTGSRSLAITLLALVAAAVIAFLLTRGSDRDTTAATAPPASGGAGGVAPSSGGAAARRAPVKVEGVSADDAAHMAEKLEFNRLKARGARDAIAGIELNRDYPFWTRPLSDANRWVRPEPHHQLQEGPDTPGRAIELWPAKKVFLAGEPVVVHARVVDGAGGAAVAVDDFWAITESPPSLGRPVFELRFADDGAAGDTAAGDRIYTARVPITKAVAAKHAGWWGYRVRATVKGEPFETSNQFQVWPTDVRLTGHYRDAVEDGSLAVYAEVEAKEAATIQVRGEVHGPNGEDIGFGWVNQDVPAGKTEVRLLFWGKVIHDRGLDGPYRIEHVVLGYPNSKLIGPDATEVAHTTRAYKAADFRSDGFNAADPLFADQLAVFHDELAKAERGELEPMPEE